MTVAQKTKKWTLMAETEDSFQRWQEAIKTAVTKAGKYSRSRTSDLQLVANNAQSGGKIAASKLKPEDIVIERTDLPTKRDSRTDSLGAGPGSNPGTPRTAREEQPPLNNQPTNHSGEFSASSGEPSSAETVPDRPPLPSRSP